MKQFLLGIGYDNDNKVQELIIGTFPWRKEKRVNIKESLQYQGKLENADLTDNFDLVGTSGELRRYTTYYTESNKIKKLSFTILAKSSHYRGDIYFIANGIDNPKWVSVDELETYIQKNGISIANAKLNVIEHKIEPLVKEFESVDFKQSQLEYKRYLKNNKGL